MKRIYMTLFIITACILMCFLLWYCYEDLKPVAPEVTPATPNPTLTRVNPLGPIVTVSNVVEDQHIYRDFNKVVGSVRDPDGTVQKLEIQITCGDYLNEFTDVVYFTAGGQQANWYQNGLDFSDTATFPGGPDNPIYINVRATDDNADNYGGPISNTYYTRIYVDDPPEITVSNLTANQSIALSPTNQIYWVRGEAPDDFGSSGLKYTFDLDAGNLQVDVTDITEIAVDPPGTLDIAAITEQLATPGIYRMSFNGSPDLSIVKSNYELWVAGTTTWDTTVPGGHIITNIDTVNRYIFFEAAPGLGSASYVGTENAMVSKGLWRLTLSGTPDISSVKPGQSIILTDTSQFNGIQTITGVDDDNDYIYITSTPLMNDEAAITATGVITATTYYIDVAESWKLPIAYYNSALSDGDHTLYVQSFDNSGQESELISIDFSISRTGARYRVREGSGTGRHYLSDENPDSGNCYAVMDTSTISLILSLLGSPVATVDECTEGSGIAGATATLNIPAYTINLIEGTPIQIEYNNLVVSNWSNPDTATLNGDVIISLSMADFGNIQMTIPIVNGSILNSGDAIAISIQDMVDLTVSLADITGNPYGLDSSKGPIEIGSDGIHIEGYGSLLSLMGMESENTFDISILLDIGIDLEGILTGLLGGGGLDMDFSSLLGELDLTLAILERQTLSVPQHPNPSASYNELALELENMELSGGVAMDLGLALAVDSSNIQIIFRSDKDGGYPSVGDPAGCLGNEVCEQNHGYTNQPDGYPDIYIHLVFVEKTTPTVVHGITLAIPTMACLAPATDLGSFNESGISATLGVHDIWLATVPSDPIHSTAAFSLTLHGFLDITSFALGFPQYFDGTAQSLLVPDVAGKADVRITNPPLDLTLTLLGFINIHLLTLEFATGEIYADGDPHPGTSPPEDIIASFGYGLFDGSAPLNEVQMNPITGDFYQGYYVQLALNLDSLYLPINIIIDDGIDLGGLFGASVLPTPLFEFVLPLSTIGGEGGGLY